MIAHTTSEYIHNSPLRLCSHDVGRVADDNSSLWKYYFPNLKVSKYPLYAWYVDPPNPSVHLEHLVITDKHGEWVGMLSKAPSPGYHTCYPVDDSGERILSVEQVPLSTCEVGDKCVRPLT